MNQFYWDSSLLQLTPKNDTPKLLQITDPHIFKSDDGCLLGLNTRHSLNAVLDDIKTNHLDADLILATGDISQDHSAESYAYFATQLEALKLPIAWVPGNHDTPEYLEEHLRGEAFVQNKRIAVGNWTLILLDSSVNDAVYGALGEQQLAFLEQGLNDLTTPHAMPVLHHHPVDIGCDWLAPIGLRDGPLLMQSLAESDAVKALLWGHIHQEYDRFEETVRLLATPSTSVQFKPFSKDFAAGEESPGYRTLYLNIDGSIDTRVHRIEHIEFTVDYTVKGY